MQAFHNTPSPGYIAWEDVHIQYKGATYNIPDGNTDKRYVIWKYADPDCFYGSDEFPTLGPDDLLVFLNKNGTYAIVPKTQIVDGSLIVSDSIMTDALAANSVTAGKISAGAITADKIAANAIGAGAIAAGAVTADEIAAGVIATAHLAALAVTADKIAANSISADKIAANAIGAEKIAAGAISADKLSIGVAEGMTGPIDADGRPISALSSQITLDNTGLKMKNADVQNVMMHLDANRLGFWAPDGEPSIGLGDVADMATALGSDMQYGLLINQGAIVAPESVIRKSMAIGAIGQKHLTQGSVTLNILSELLSVTMPERLIVTHVINATEGSNLLTNPGFENGLVGWSGTGAATAPAHTGAKSVYKPDVSQTVTFAPGDTLVLDAYAYGNGKRLYFTITFKDNTGATLQTDPRYFDLDQVAWLRCRAIVTAPADTAQATIRIYDSNAGIRVDDCALRKSAVGSAPLMDYTIPATEACEQIRVDVASASSTTWVLSVNGTTVLSATGTEVSATVDMRPYGDNQRVTLSSRWAVYMSNATATLSQNQRLPIRAARPRYSVSTCGGSCQTNCQASCQATCQYGCQSECESSCQTMCQTGCQSSCQSTCQDSCQSACQSVCEQTSQGGGCWVAGTPVTVYLPESETATDIPVEQLEPGMQMPYYDPATDTLAITECLSNQRSYTHTIYVAEVEGGWMLEMTREQPMDVLRAHLVTGQIMWHRVQARYLRAGDKLIRPFDKTLHEVLSVREEERPRTWVWNPRTAAGAYIAHGFADAISKT